MVCGQKIALGRLYRWQTLTIAVSETTLTVELPDQDPKVFRRMNLPQNRGGIDYKESHAGEAAGSSTLISERGAVRLVRETGKQSPRSLVILESMRAPWATGW